MDAERRLNRRGFLAALAGAAGAGAIWKLRPRAGGGEGGRLPPGQRWVDDLIEYSAGGRPGIDEGAWRLTVGGLVGGPLSLTLEEFRSLPHVDSTSDFHCVTTWSVPDCRWRGVRLADLLAMAAPLPAAAFVAVGCHGGYSTNFPLAVGRLPDVLLADGYRGAPLERRFGGPVRLVVPSLYAYKSAKWVREITLLDADRPGFWESAGYSNRADPWKEQRWARDDARG
ncbi:MAG: molybdopterin-dependent oxidoreductase [bacterium]|nr:molybdopterin-dependent oxidoreductase [bacterium]